MATETVGDGGGGAAVHRIAVGVDGSPGATAAVRWAATQAHRSGAELRIATAFGPSSDFIGHDDAQKHMDDVVDQARHEALEVDPDLTITHQEHFGRPDLALQSESGEADLLVVGSRGKGGFAGLLLGSVSRQCVHRSICPVVVVRGSVSDDLSKGAIPRVAGREEPGGSVAGAARRIVVGADGSSSSDAALRWAADQAEATGSDLEVLMAWDWVTTYGWGFVIPPDLDPEGDSRRVLEESLGPVRSAHPGVTFSSAVVQGPAADLLVKSSAQADLLVVGSRGHGELAGMVLGSVSEYCVSHAHCPVLVMHQRPAAAPA
jgi:nucleotide-binding universal stress UspA family protein